MNSFQAVSNTSIYYFKPKRGKTKRSITDPHALSTPKMPPLKNKRKYLKGKKHFHWLLFINITVLCLTMDTAASARGDGAKGQNSILLMVTKSVSKFRGVGLSSMVIYCKIGDFFFSCLRNKRFKFEFSSGFFFFCIVLNPFNYNCFNHNKHIKNMLIYISTDQYDTCFISEVL